MDTRWKKFRYGTEGQNASWSFFGSILCSVFALTAFALLSWRGSGVWMAAGLWFLVFSAVSLVHLGKTVKNEKENVFPVRIFDKTYPDLVLFLLLAILASFLFTEGWNGNSGWWQYSHMVNQAFCCYWQPLLFLWYFSGVIFITGTIVAFSVILYMSLMRQLYREKFRKKLFFFRLDEFIRKKWKNYQKKWEKNQTARMKKGEAAKIFRGKQMKLLCGQGLLFALVCLYLAAAYYDLEDIMLLVFLLGSICFLTDLLFLLQTSREIGILLDEISHIAEDSLILEKPELKPYSVFYQAEEALLDIQRNKKESMEKRLQSERMKVDLITNVSHDLKTPLTSMIGCIDLLKQVEGLPEEAQDYVNLLSGRAERLRSMIQDVFEMAKATSGGQNLKLERLDMVRLIRQTLADMQDRIRDSGLHFRVKTEEEELYFLGDSRKMYRVYQNLIENTLKYSMAGSRVYVEVSKGGEDILTSIKNTSKCEMDFSAEEIMERFTRGDRSRSTEGNGLGISIARSFTEACGGSFQVVLDGDLFRVDTVFPML